MNVRILFEQFPDAKECYVAGSDAFLNEEDAKGHAKHFKLNVKKVLREELEEAPKDEIKSANAVVSSTDDTEDENPEAESDEDTQATKETPATKEAAVTDETPATKEAAVTDETPATKEAAVTDETKAKKGKDA
ncbi:hypothetical protein VB796_21000 [Arcicella sp. LKC2W]|uniref:hypothetical protein n=1 Tax=Arcicella sp. LKC2W TaxID=2984198 RepID=UPI002B21D103|nr:hypothetical protein [Arcicella sp. LKC2W]MEA5461558.1 hypothetical protein [Arcicella sp. LKC2W]